MTIRLVVAAAAITIMSFGACSLAGLDDYVSGNGGSNAGGSNAGGSNPGGSNTGGQVTGSGGEGTGGSSCAGLVCAGSCVDPLADAAHCGACGRACAVGYTCMSGVCGNAVIDFSTMLVSCAALRSGELWCWGRNVWGELGIPPATSDHVCPFYSDRCQIAPVKIPGLSGVVEVSAGAEATCARTSAGDVYCWGGNGRALLGHNPATDPICTKAGGPNSGITGPCSPTPQKVALPAGVKAAQLVMGTAVVCARTTTKDVYCWGNNSHGEIRAPVGGEIWQPVKNANVSGDAEEIAASLDMMGDYSTVCFRQTGTSIVRCWGGSSDGALFPASGTCADGCDPVAHVVPQSFGPQSGALTAGQIQIGWLTGAGSTQGVVTAWGDNNYGQSGKGASSAAPFDPTVIVGLPGITSVSMRFLTTLMIDANRSVWALGWGDEGQLGLGAYPQGNCPIGNGQKCVNTVTSVPGLSGIVKVHAAANNAAAIDEQGKLWIWGANYAATLGHPPGTSGDVPCAGEASLLCNPTPQIVTGLP